MNKNIQLEFIWWLITAVIIVLVMFPIWSAVGTDFQYHTSNILAIFILVTYTRLIFVLRHSLIARRTGYKALFIILSIPLFVYFTDRLNDFKIFVDDNGYSALLPDQIAVDAVNITQYVRYEYIFFSVAALMVVIMVPFRMLLSIWRTRNRGTV